MTFRSIALVGAALVALATAASAADADGRWYVGAGVGVAMPGNVEGIPFDTTWRGIASFGYDMNMIRLETEIGYTDPSVSGSNSDANVDVEQLTVMVNALYDLPLADKFGLTIGGGIGLVHATVSASLTGYGSGSASGNGLAWQGIAGVTYKLTDDVNLQLDYRYIGAEQVNFSGYHLSQYSNNIMVSAQYHF